MNAAVHAQLSARTRGGTPEEWYAIHDFMDWSKEAESSNAHRAFSHSMWFVKQVVIPVFGHTLHLSDGSKANVKDAMEQDHILADFSNRFIPTLDDYLSCTSDDPDDQYLIERFDKENTDFYQRYPEVRELMLSPLGLTGKVKSLLITHNSWFVQRILPKVFPRVPVEIRAFSISPTVFFNRMTFTDWMNNGKGSPPSFAKIYEHRERKRNPKGTSKVDPKESPSQESPQPAPRAPRPAGSDMVYDGGRRPTGADVVLDGGRGTSSVEDLKKLFDEQTVGRVVTLDGAGGTFDPPPVEEILRATPKPSHLKD